MPLASAVAINFSAPLFATLISAVVLAGDGRRGALVRAHRRLPGRPPGGRPGRRQRSRSARCSRLANAVLYGSVTVGVRHMTATESTETLTIYQLLLLTLFFAIPLPFGFG